MQLTELHGIVCTGPKSCASADFAHMADADVAMTWDIFKYYKQKIENPERSKKGQDASEVKLHESQKRYNPPLDTTTTNFLLKGFAIDF